MISYTKQVRVNNDVLYVSIPAEISKAEDIKEGDLVSITINKINTAEKDSE